MTRTMCGTSNILLCGGVKRNMFTNREYQPFFRTSLGTLLQGDCLEIMPAMRPGIFDLILCDLPYGITDLEWDKRIPMEPLWREYWRLLKPNGTVVLTAQQPFATDLIQAARKFFRYELIWEKTCALGFLNAKKMPLRAHENLLVFYRALPVYNPQMVPGAPTGAATVQEREESTGRLREEKRRTRGSVIRGASFDSGMGEGPPIRPKSRCSFSSGWSGPSRTLEGLSWTTAWDPERQQWLARRASGDGSG